MYMYRNKSVQEKLMFIFSADNLSQMYRRLRYVREYADYQRRQGLEVQRKQKQVANKQQTLLASREAKQQLLHQGEAESKNWKNRKKNARHCSLRYRRSSGASGRNSRSSGSLPTV